MGPSFLTTRNLFHHHNGVCRVFRSDTFAQHLCILDADFYRSIEPSEFVLAAMSDTQDSLKTPNFSAAVDHFNSVSYWTQGLILSQNSPGKDATDLRERILNNVSSVFFLPWFCFSFSKSYLTYANTTTSTLISPLSPVFHQKPWHVFTGNHRFMKKFKSFKKLPLWIKTSSTIAQF